MGEGCRYLSMTGLMVEVQAVVLVLLVLLVTCSVGAVRDNSEGSTPICLSPLQGSPSSPQP